MKKIATLLIGIVLGIGTAAAQEPEATVPATTPDLEYTQAAVSTTTIDSLRQQVNELNQQLAEQEEEDLNERVWKGRAKYFNIGYVSQKLINKDYDVPALKNDFGVSLSWGKTFYLHKKPLFGMLKFGLDWSWIDLNYSQYTTTEYDEGSDPTGGMLLDTYDIGNHQLEYGMQFGPSVTINPVQDLKISLYFRVTPSYSMMFVDSEFNSNYATFLNFGGAIAWKVISVGVEGRWGSAKYKGIAIDEIDFDNEEFPLSTSSTKTKLKTSSIRFYIGFRF